MSLEIKKKIKNVAIFSNMVQVSTINEGKVYLHEDGLPIYNTWHLTEYHFVDDVLFRGSSDDLPIEYKPFLTKIGTPKNVIVTKSTQDTY